MLRGRYTETSKSGVNEYSFQISIKYFASLNCLNKGQFCLVSIRKLPFLHIRLKDFLSKKLQALKYIVGLINNMREVIHLRGRAETNFLVEVS